MWTIIVGDNLAFPEHTKTHPPPIYHKRRSSFPVSGGHLHQTQLFNMTARNDSEGEAGKELIVNAPVGQSDASDSTTNKDSTTTSDVITNFTIFPYHIGGPHTRLPIVVESFLGWSLCLSCLAVSGYHYAKSILLSSKWYMSMHRRVHGVIHVTFWRFVGGDFKMKKLHANTEIERPWIPLTTHSRAELDRCSPWERYLSLVRVLEKQHPETLYPLVPENGDSILDERDYSTKTGMNGGISKRLSNMEDFESLKQKADAELIRVIRHDDVCRRLASLTMRPHDVAIETVTTITTQSSSKAKTNSNSVHPKAVGAPATFVPAKICSKTDKETITTTLLQQLPHNRLLRRLYKLWDHFLVLPTLDEAMTFYRLPTTPQVIQTTINNHQNAAYYPYRISLIIPAFHEKGEHLLAKLSNALRSARGPHEIEVIVVDAGGCSDLDLLLSTSSDGGHENAYDEKIGDQSFKQWGRICIVEFQSGGGRGPCLNYGASSSTGRVLTFCHSDATLPRYWDDSIVSTLEHDGMDEEELARKGIARANSCAFAFGIDTSAEGLSMPFAHSTKFYHPPGIRAVETTANIRTHLYSLPYGDQVISLHACVFHFLGGFPDQCLMEDYELVSLLRRRSALFTPPLSEFGNATNKEKLAIILGPPALCSPRRWQKFGVLFVTFMNSRLVNLYAGGMKLSPDDLFRLYYDREPPPRLSECSPWELDMID